MSDAAEQWPRGDEAARAMESYLDEPPPKATQYDQTVLEAKAMATAAMGRPVEIRDTCLVMPVGVGKLQLWMKPEPWWRRFWRRKT